MTILNPHSQPTETAAGDGNRVAHRHKVFLPARMVTPQGDLRVHLINVSLTGALVHHDAPPRPGTVVAIEIDGWTIGGRIVWADGRRFGIAFAGRLDERRLDSLFQAAPRGAAPERHAR